MLWHFLDPLLSKQDLGLEPREDRTTCTISHSTMELQSKVDVCVRLCLRVVCACLCVTCLCACVCMC